VSKVNSTGHLFNFKSLDVSYGEISAVFFFCGGTFCRSSTAEPRQKFSFGSYSCNSWSWSCCGQL